MSALQHVNVEAMDPQRFESVLSVGEFEALRYLIADAARGLHGRVIWNVNSTANGGGVAEMLRPLLGYCRGLGVDARWAVISGNPEFFLITKRIHNRLHGFARRRWSAGRRRARDLRPHPGRQRGRAGRARASGGRRDPPRSPNRRSRAVSAPDGGDGDLALPCRSRQCERLRPWCMELPAWIRGRGSPIRVLARGFAWEGLPRERITVIHPSIDAFSPKNADQSIEQSRAILSKAGIVPQYDTDPATFTRSDGTPGRIDRPAAIVEDEPLGPEDRLVVQVSRWDGLKDPLGVLGAFAQHVDAASGAHLLLAGPSTEAVADDPEGAQVLASVVDAWHALPGEVRRRVHVASLPMEDSEENAAIVNSVQRAASVVIQKSLAEGFGLTVAEAMWKERPVVASRIGGIRDQIDDGRSGLLISDPRDLKKVGEAVGGLLADRERADRMGPAARVRVQQHFLGPQHLGRYFEVIQRLASERVMA